MISSRCVAVAAVVHHPSPRLIVWLSQSMTERGCRSCLLPEILISTFSWQEGRSGCADSSGRIDYRSNEHILSSRAELLLERNSLGSCWRWTLHVCWLRPEEISALGPPYHSFMRGSHTAVAALERESSSARGIDHSFAPPCSCHAFAGWSSLPVTTGGAARIYGCAFPSP